ncbi:MAG: HU family DNA-binding protein [Prevotella sp.]|nr:HU family DNA-binding protein [Prevotella sp.]
MIKLTDLAARLAAKHSIRQEDAERFLNEMINVMNDSLRTEKQLKIKGLGTFKVVPVHARESVDVNTGERIKIEGREKVSFTPEANMRDLVNRPFAQFETVVLKDGVDFSEIDSKFAETEALEPQEVVEEPEVQPQEVVKEPVSEVPETVEEIVEEPVGEVSETVEEIVEEPVSEIPEPVEEMVEEPVGEVHQFVEEVVEEPEPVKKIMPKKKRKRRKSYEEEEYDDDMFDEYGYYIGPKEEDKSWIRRLLKNKKALRWLMSIMIAIMACMFLGMCLLYLEVRKRDEDIEKFTAEMERIQANNESVEERLAAVREAGAERFYEHERRVDSIKQAMLKDTTDYSEAVRVARVFQDAEIKRKEERLEREQKERKEAEERRQAQERREDAQRKTVISGKAALARELEAFNSDARVRTGAYVITGIDRTVTVQKGQTLHGISKAWLGPGMECYVEAVNGGIKSVEPGQEVKIPSLKLKKYHSPK